MLSTRADLSPETATKVLEGLATAGLVCRERTARVLDRLQDMFDELPADL
jgi:hypothetical protein